MQQKVRFMLVFIAFLLITGCGSSTDVPPERSSIPNVTIAILEGMRPEAKEIKIETIPQNNCGGTAEVENEITKSKSIERVIIVEGRLEVNANGQIGFAGTDVELGATVAGMLGHQYGTVEDISRSLTVKAKAGTNMEHKIKQVEIWEVGTAKIVVNGQEITVPFRFRNDFAIELVGSRDIGDCSTQPPPMETTSEDEATSTSVQPTNIPWIQEATGIPQSGTQINWELGPNQVMFLSGGQFQIGDTFCGGDFEQICVLVYEATVKQNVTIQAVIRQHNYVGITETYTPEQAVNDKEAYFWIPPNCGGGCKKATVLFVKDGELIETLTKIAP